MPARAKHKPTEYEKALRLYRFASSRHVLVLEADMPEDMKRRAFGLSEQLRTGGNEVTAHLSKAMGQLFRTKEYRGLAKAYGTLSGKLKANPDDRDLLAERKAIANRMSAMQKAYHATWEDTRKHMMFLKDRDGIDSIFALSRAEDIWDGAENVLYHGADRLHFKKRGDLPEIRAKQANRGIVLSVRNGRLYFSCRAVGKDPFTYKAPDRFQSDELAAVLHYMEAPKAHDRDAVRTMLGTGEITDTCRPCFASLVCREIRGRLRVYIHLTVEGMPVPKNKSDGITPRHAYGTGKVGADIGTQTVAYTSDTEVGLRNLSERGMAIRKSERLERILQRKLDRSRRAMNPGNYHADGTVRRGGKTWVMSRRGKEVRRRYRELCRKNADSRKYAIREDAHHLRSLGDVLMTEPPNFRALQKRAKPAAQNDKSAAAPSGRKRRKRFGRTIRNRCPGAFQAALKEVFLSTGGSYHEVDKNFRASQYDHTGDAYIKKKLSQRMFDLTDGSHVQRDWYSSFLLYNADRDYAAPDRGRCIQTFDKLFRMHLCMIEDIKRSGVHVMNSGIL